MALDPNTLTLDDQVALLMQGTEFGDDTLAKNMARELRARLEKSMPAATRSRSIAATTRAHPICIWATPSPCASCASFRSWGTR